MECPCCLDTVDDYNTASCSLGCIFCITCIRTYAKEELMNNRIEFKCISANGCTGMLGHSNKEYVLGKDIINSILRTEQNINIRLAAIENLYTCPLCPFMAIYNPDEDGNIFMCPECKVATCSICKKNAHYDTECKIHRTSAREARRRQREEDKTSMIVKPCRTCNVDIEKTDGCNRVTCVCGSAICWICGNKVSPTNYDHFNRDSCSLFASMQNEENHRDNVNEVLVQPVREHRRQLNPPVRIVPVATNVQDLYFGQTGQEAWQEYAPILYRIHSVETQLNDLERLRNRMRSDRINMTRQDEDAYRELCMRRVHNNNFQYIDPNITSHSTRYPNPFAYRHPNMNIE